MSWNKGELHLKLKLSMFRALSLFCKAVPGGGAIECQGGYQACPKIHVIRVVFQDQAMYARTSFWGAKCAKLEKRVCFWSYKF